MPSSGIPAGGCLHPVQMIRPPRSVSQGGDKGHGGMHVGGWDLSLDMAWICRHMKICKRTSIFLLEGVECQQ